MPRIEPLQQNTADWHRWRQQGLGASDAPVIMGEAAFKTPRMLWSIKTGRMLEDAPGPDQTAAPAVAAAPKPEPKSEPKAEPKTEPKAEPKAKRGAQAAKGAPAKGKATKKTTPAKKAPKAAKGAKQAKAEAGVREGSKTATVVALLERKGGATLAEVMKATDWQAHSVRGFISGTLGKKMGLTVASERRADGEHVYSIA